MSIENNPNQEPLKKILYMPKGIYDNMTKNQRESISNIIKLHIRE